MSVKILKNKLIIECNTTDDPAETLLSYKNAIYDLIAEHDQEYNDNKSVHYAIQLLKDLELSPEQIKVALQEN